MRETFQEHATPNELLQTKLYRPTIRPGLVARARLLQRLNAGLRSGSTFARKLTLIAAPAGFGKTTLVTEWMTALASHGEASTLPGPPMTPGWLSLDDADNDPARFLRYLLAALLQAVPSPIQIAPPLLQTSAAPALEAALEGVINVIAGIADPVLLVLDDYHVIHSAGVEALMAFLLNHQPTNLHLVIATRTDPALPLSRLRARGQLLELRIRDLRFAAEETVEFLTRTMGLSLEPPWIAALEQRTEGWIAGLQLAALSLQGRDDPEAFVQAFSGSHRYVIDYLVDEVLSHQSPEVRGFLVQTSVLDRLCAQLCDAVLSPSLLHTFEDSQTLLEHLERANLFVIPLDDRRQWYRYHHLFAGSLRTALDASQQRELRQRAALWFEAQDLPTEAVAHGLAGGDLNFAAGLIERAIQDPVTWSGGQLATLVGWLDALPDVIVDGRPAMSLHVSRALYLSGRIDESEQLLDRAEAALDGREDEEAGELLALAAIYRGAIAVIRGQVQDAIRWVERGLARLPASAKHARARACDVLGTAYRYRGDVQRAERHFLEAAALAQEAGVAYLAINARCEAAQAQMAQGRLLDAAQTCREALQVGHTPIPPHGLARAILGEIAREQNDLHTAEEQLRQGLGLAKQGGLIDDIVMILNYLAWLKHNQDDTEGAQETLAQVTHTLQTYGIERLTLNVAAQQAHLDLVQGRLDLAVAWAHAYEKARAAQTTEYLREVEDLTLARVWMVTGRPRRARTVLDSVVAQAQVDGRSHRATEGGLLTALALHREGQVIDAAHELQQAVTAAAPEKWLRLFLDETGLGTDFSAALATLLPRVRNAAPTFVDELLSALGAPHEGTAAPNSQPHREPQPAIEALGEPLSEREIEILQLLAEGMTNREISQALYIGVGTVKWYLHHLYIKLEVGNRTEAVARAREHGLI